jgi:hypothetical protein
MQPLRNRASRQPSRSAEVGEVPRWAGASVVILASGPSLTVEQCCGVHAWRDCTPGGRVVAINNTFQRAPWADLLYACDATWWRVHMDEVRRVFHGELWTQDEVARREFGVRRVESQRLPGLGRRPGVIHQGGNSGYQAINLVWQMGVKRIILLGFDMRGSHWHGKHVGLANTPDWLFKQWIKNFAVLAADLEREDVEVVNCTPGSALDCFRMGELGIELA